MRRGTLAGLAVVFVAAAIAAFYLLPFKPAKPAQSPISDAPAAANDDKPAPLISETEPTSPPSDMEAAIRAAAPTVDTRYPIPGDDALREVKIYGTVTDAATGEAVSGAMVYTDAFGAMLERAGNPSAIEDERLQMAGLTEDEFRKLMSSGDALPENLQGKFGAANAVADSSGAFSITVSVPLTESVSCRAKGYARATQAVSDGSGSSVRVDFQLRKGASISGKVTDLKTGEPVADVVVRAGAGTQGPRMPWMEMEGSASEHTATADDGTYTIDGVPEGQNAVTVEDDVHGWLFDTKRTANITLAAGEAKSGVDLVVTQGLRVEGSVQNEAGQPVANARISSFTETEDFMEMARQAGNAASVRSDDSGDFVVVGLRAGKSSIRVAHEDYAEASSEVTIAEGEQTPHVEFTLVKGVEVSGTAQYDDGTPAGSESLYLMQASSNDAVGNPFAISALQDRKYAHTEDDDGAFTFENVPAGDYLLTNSPEFEVVSGDEADEKRTVAVKVDGKNPITGLTITISKEEARHGDGAIIAGTVLDREGNPAVDVAVRAVSKELEQFAGGMPFDHSEKTGMDGTFKLENSYGSVFTVYAESEAGEASQPNVKPGDTITLRLGPVTSVSGSVVDANGDPVPGCSVELTAAIKENSMASMMSDMMGSFMPGRDSGEKTDDFGQFKFLHVKEGDYVVEATSSGKGFGSSEQFAIAKSAEKSGIRIVLEAGAAFAGIVVDGTGTPVQGANVSLIESTGGPMESMMMSLPMGMGPQAAAVATSGADGSFALSGLKPGRFMLSAKHADFAPFTDKGIDIGASQSSPYRVTLAKGGSARGQFVVDGKPKGNVMIQLMGPGGMQMVKTDSEGRFEVKGLPAGTYMVNPIDLAGMQQNDDAPGMQMNFETVTITEGGDVTVTFGGGVAVNGTIPAEHLGKMTFAYLMRKGAPEMPNMTSGMNPFEMMESGMDMFQHMAGMTAVEDDGTFNFKGIDPGEYELRVYASPVGVDDIDPTQFMNMSFEEMQQQSQAFAPKEVFKQPVTVGDAALTVEFGANTVDTKTE